MKPGFSTLIRCLFRVTNLAFVKKRKSAGVWAIVSSGLTVNKNFLLFDV